MPQLVKGAKTLWYRVDRVGNLWLPLRFVPSAAEQYPGTPYQNFTTGGAFPLPLETQRWCVRLSGGRETMIRKQAVCERPASDLRAISYTSPRDLAEISERSPSDLRSIPAISPRSFLTRWWMRLDGLMDGLMA